MSMYVILWRFRPVVGQESEFERAYGPSGEWARLFRRDEGYLGTELLLSGSLRGAPLENPTARVSFSPSPSPYPPKCLERGFSELRVDGVLGSSLRSAVGGIML